MKTEFQQELFQPINGVKETKSSGWGRFYATPAGTFPSVTTVLSIMPKPGLDEWRERVGETEAKRITKEAVNRGSRFHTVMEKFLLNEKDIFMDLVVKEHFLQVRNTLYSLVEKVHALEVPLYSRLLRVAGRCDCIAAINGKLHIVDFKTSKKEKSEEDITGYKLQCSAYTVMANEVYGLEIKDFVVILSNLEENFPSVYFGKAKDHIGEFYDLRKRFGNG